MCFIVLLFYCFVVMWRRRSLSLCLMFEKWDQRLKTCLMSLSCFNLLFAPFRAVNDRSDHREFKGKTLIDLILITDQRQRNIQNHVTHFKTSSDHFSETKTNYFRLEFYSLCIKAAFLESKINFYLKKSKMFFSWVIFCRISDWSCCFYW